VLAFRPLGHSHRAPCVSGVYGGSQGVTASGWPPPQGARCARPRR
jgi:hypothetical protein